MRHCTVIASVLKPIRDIRSYHKIGKTIISHFDTSLYLIGQASLHEDDTRSSLINSIPHSFHRTSLKRLFYPALYFLKLIKIKPNVIIICTHELLFASWAYRLFFPSKLIYDVQEDYFKNCYHSNAYPRLFSILLAYYVRIKEKIFSPWVTHFLLAEKIYTKDLNFIQNKSTIIENKALHKPKNLDNLLQLNLTPFKRDKNNCKEVRIIITGTLSKKFGIFSALSFFEVYRKKTPSASLHIVGYAPLVNEQQKIKDYIKTRPYIYAIGIDTLVPHEKIIQLVSESDLVLMPYMLDQDTMGRIPTKLYECLSLHKPMLIQENDDWQKITEEYKAAVYIDFENYDIEKTQYELANTSFYIKKVSNDIYWLSEEKKLIKALLPYYTH